MDFTRNQYHFIKDKINEYIEVKLENNSIKSLSSIHEELFNLKVFILKEINNNPEEND